ncbi:MAG: FAD-dependent oxidoreductase [Azoarcus sp.]|jgi:succinate dehydrogenase/fumarate reductase flavoprotein subunit|nr:FAD-dependent oxidoreductase [Azoarcus sp.]
MTSMHWDREIDVVVIGTGAGGMAAALTARIEGLSVLLVEKTDCIGGSTAVSGGVVWAPANHHAAAVGQPDSVEKALTYLDSTVGDATPAPLKRRFVEACGEMIEYFARHSEVRFAARGQAPDYYPERPGAALGGRALDPLEFDGRSLGAHFSKLRVPLSPFLVLGGMMVNTADVKHLLAVTKSFGSWKHGTQLILRYFCDRLRGYSRGTRLVLGNALAGRLLRSLLDRGVEPWLSASVKQLHTNEDGVQGVTIEYQGRTASVRARHGVVVACGGFPWNAELRESYFPKPSGPWSMAPEGNCGDGLRYAQNAGAALGTGHAGPALWAPVSIHSRADGTEVRFPHLVWDRAKPGLMAVNGAGERFVNEATSYHEFVLAMRRSHQRVPTVPAYLVCDRDFLRKWGLGLALPGRRPRGQLIRDGYLHRGDTLRELATRLNINPDQFEASVGRFNVAAARGEDPDFGKGGDAYNRYLGDPGHEPNPCLAPLARAPFYAVAVYPGDIGTALGIRCDEDARALDATGQVIRGLYVAGNDMHSVMGGHYPGAGITLGPALTFGWLAGRHLARSTESASTPEKAIWLTRKESDPNRDAATCTSHSEG